MLPQKIAFVDIETTGASLRSDRIIEIGVLRVENNRVVDTYKSLVNPETHIPSEIETLTGISQADIENAPTFPTIKKDLLNILDDCIFAAHNVRFDYGFVRSELKREGVTYRAKNLCTVKLSRNLFPRFKRHNLDAVMERCGISCENRHRAFDDAQVIWEFYQQALKGFPEEKIEKVINRILRKPSLPVRISEDELDKLHDGPGVYIFYGEKGMPLYIGKSINVHDRVLSHFAGDIDDGKEMKIAQQIESIEVIPTAGELGALLKESQLVKEMQPLYNRHLRNARKVVVLKMRRELDGYHGVTIEETGFIDPGELDQIVSVFKSRKQVKEFLIGITKEHELCEKLLGLENGKGACFGYRLGKCKGACLGREKAGLYNARLAVALMKHRIRPWPFDGPIMISEGDEEKTEAHVLDKWCYLGTVDLNDKEYPMDSEVRFDVDMYKILNRFLRTSAIRPINISTRPALRESLDQ